MRPALRLSSFFCTVPLLLVSLPGFPVSAQEQQQEPREQRPDCAVAAPAPAAEITRQAELSALHRGIPDFATGAGITVAVIDTGIYPHPRLPQVIDGGDFINGTPAGALEDCDAHGTVVAGIIAARDTGDGIIGVAPEVRLLSLRQTSSKIRNPETKNTSGTLASLTAAINSAIDQGAQVINTSVLSCIPPATTETGTSFQVDTYDFDQAMRRAEDSGVVVVSAAGNSNDACPAGSTVYPAHHELALGVAALADPYTKTDYTLASPFPQASAPGSAFAGLSNTGDYLSQGIANNNEVVSYEGTSFAAPFVTGVVALLKQRHPTATPAQLRSLIYASTDPSSGAVDAQRTVRYLADGPAPHNHGDYSLTTQSQAVTSGPQLRFIRGGYTLMSSLIVMVLVVTLQNCVHHRVQRRNRTKSPRHVSGTSDG